MVFYAVVCWKNVCLLIFKCYFSRKFFVFYFLSETVNFFHFQFHYISENVSSIDQSFVCALHSTWNTKVFDSGLSVGRRSSGNYYGGSGGSGGRSGGESRTSCKIKKQCDVDIDNAVADLEELLNGNVWPIFYHLLLSLIINVCLPLNCSYFMACTCGNVYMFLWFWINILNFYLSILVNCLPCMTMM